MDSLGANPVRVMCVDDDPGLADVVTTYLDREHDELTAEPLTDVDAALTHLRNHPVDAIVSDYEMPGKTGLDFLKVVGITTH